MLSKEGYEKLLSEIKSEFPQFEIVKKQESKLMKSISLLLKIVSFGKMKTFMESFITTLGEKVYVPTAWDTYSTATKAITLRHERVHMRQAKRTGRIAFSLLYLLVPFPVVFAYFRMKFEKEGYEESLRAYNEYYGPRFFTQGLKDSIVSHFTTSEYIWMWPWKADVERWYDETINKIIEKNHK